MTENAKLDIDWIGEEHADEDLYWKPSMISSEAPNNPNHSNRKMEGSLIAEMETLSRLLEQTTQENNQKMEELKRYQENRFSIFHRRSQLRTSIQKMYKLNKEKHLLPKEILPVNEFNLVELTRGSYDWSLNTDNSDWLGSCVARHISHSFDLGLLQVGEIIEVNQNYKWVSAVVLQIKCDLGFFRYVKVKLRTKQWEPSVWIAVEDGRIRRCNGENVHDTWKRTTSINLLDSSEVPKVIAEIKSDVGVVVKDDKSLSRPSTAGSSDNIKKSSRNKNTVKLMKKKRKREIKSESDSDISSDYEVLEYRRSSSRAAKKQIFSTQKDRKDGSTQCEAMITDDDDAEKPTTLIVSSARRKVNDRDVMISTSPAKIDLAKQPNHDRQHLEEEDSEMTIEIINYNSRNGDGNSGDSNNSSVPLSLPGSENSSRSDLGSDSPVEVTPIEAPSLPDTEPQIQPKQTQSVVIRSSTFSGRPPAVSVATVPLPTLAMRDPRVTLLQQLHRHQYVPLHGYAPLAPFPGMGGIAMIPARRHPLQYHPDLLGMGMEQGGTTYRLGSNGAVLKNEEKK